MLFHDIAIIGPEGQTQEHMSVRVKDQLIESIEPASQSLEEVRVLDKD
ncbi:MAG TPA: hypothetical protein GX720_00315, partial [Clostridiaceae bacterium]|nr:hypothetical protein [Clostridiaceae bacterium]